MRSIKVLIVDDHRLICQGLKLLLERQPDMAVIAEAYDGRTAVQVARTHRPQVVVMDIAMPELNGIDASRQIIQELPGTKVVALTAMSDRHVVTETLGAGVSGYVLKESAVDDLVNAIRTAISGSIYLSPKIAGTVVASCVRGGGAGGGGTTDVDRQSAFGRLTAREREVLQLTAEGKATKEVAMCLGVSVKTAETHRRSIMEKLNLHSVAELTKYAIREGLTSVDM
jgi:DNA-binding NarL/FixJ family response regulator